MKETYSPQHITPKQELEFVRETGNKILKAFTNLRKEMDYIQEELEIMANPKLVRNIRESKRQMKEGKLESWKKFKEIVDTV
jgi:hypothetical protein